MRFLVSYIANIPDDELIEARIDLDDLEAIQDYFYSNIPADYEEYTVGFSQLRE